MNELQSILAASNAPVDVKVKALTMAFEIATPMAVKSSAGNGQAGEFMQLLLEILKMLLPLLLKLLSP